MNRSNEVLSREGFLAKENNKRLLSKLYLQFLAIVLLFVLEIALLVFSLMIYFSKIILDIVYQNSSFTQQTDFYMFLVKCSISTALLSVMLFFTGISLKRALCKVLKIKREDNFSSVNYNRILTNSKSL